MTAPTLEQLPVRIPGRALAAAVRDYPAPDADAPQASATEQAVAKLHRILDTADPCTCCGKPPLSALVDEPLPLTPFPLWIDVDTQYLKASFNPFAKDLLRQYAEARGAVFYPNGRIRIPCDNHDQAAETRRWLLAWGIPERLAIINGSTP